jgi:hypothetical protein
MALTAFNTNPFIYLPLVCFKQELQSLRVAKVTGGAASKLAKM